MRRSIMKFNFGLFAFIFLIGLNLNAQSGRLKVADDHFEKLSFVDAIRNYENWLLTADSKDKYRKSALTNLAFSYRKVQDYRNAERVYNDLFEAFESDLQSEQFLYYAQTLASNQKYRESQKYYAAYGKQQTLDLRGRRFTVAYMDNSQFYKDSSLYRIKYMYPLNSRQSDFAPMYFEDGIVFVSAREEGGIIKRVFMQNETPFLDLFLYPDTALLHNQTLKTENMVASLGGSSDDGGASVRKEKEGHDPEKDPEIEEFSKSINSKYHEGPVTFFKDYKRVIFTRNNYNKGKAGKNKDGVNMLKLYTAEKKEKKWSNIKELPFNSNEFSCGHPALSAHDDKLYFVSDRPGGYGGTDIWMVDYRNGEWSTPVNMGKEINTEGNEMFPYVDENDNLYFASDGHAGLGGLDIFFTELQNGQPISDIENLGYPINTEKDDFGLITNGDRSEGYFSSNRRRGYSDDNIYSFERKCRSLKLLVYDAETGEPIPDVEIRMVQNGINQQLYVTDQAGAIETCMSTAIDFEFRAFKEGYESSYVSYGTMSRSLDNKAELKMYLPKSKLPLVKGTIRSELTNEPIAGAKVLLKNSKDNSTVTVITGEDGKYEFQPQRAGKYIVQAVKDKYATNTEEIGKLKGSKKNNITYEQNLGMIAEGDIFRIPNIYYDFGKYAIRTDARRELENVVLPVLKKYPSLKIEIRSHTDSRATSSFNKELSDKRAKEVVNFLVKRGISEDRLIASGYGEELLVNNCQDGVSCNENQHQQNRRTEFKILAVEDRIGRNR